MKPQAVEPSRPGRPLKVPIPRLERRKENEGLPQINNKQRVLKACIGCRARKVRCSGEHPRCKRCISSNQPCIYVDSRRDRLKATAERNRDMTKFLKDLRHHVTKETCQQIDDFLQHVSVNTSDTPSLNSQSSPDPPDVANAPNIFAKVNLNDKMNSADEDLLRDEDTRATEYIGKSSEFQWLFYLQRETERLVQPPLDLHGPSVPSGELPMPASQHKVPLTHREQHKTNLSTPARIPNLCLDSGSTGVESTVNPFEMPSMEVAQRLCDCYMRTVQDSFPVLSSVTFIDQLHRYYTSKMHGTPLAMPAKWLAIANLVFAIAAKYSHLVEADWQADKRDHHLYRSRACILGLNGADLFSNPDILHIQTTALLAFYNMSIGRIKSAWVIIGFSLRLAHALGLHLRNETQPATTAKKETLVRMWWSLYSLEGLLSTIVGRPSSVVEGSYSTPLPLPLAVEQLSDETPACNFVERHGDTSTIPATMENNTIGLGVSNSGSYLKSRVQIDVIIQRAMVELYSVRVSAKLWTQVQEAISGLSEQLERWSASLPIGINFTQQNSNTSLQRERLILKMHYLRAKILITRPCLCRPDRRLINQPETSSDFDRQTARACIDAAKTMANLLPDRYDSPYLYRTGPWWCVVYNLMQALVILLLEMSYGSFRSSRGEDILPSMKKLIRWIRAMKNDNQIAKQGYGVAFGILQRLASQADADVTDLLIEHAADLQKLAAPNYGLQYTSGDEYIFSQQFENQGADIAGFYGNPSGYRSMFAFTPRSIDTSSLPTQFSSLDQLFPGDLAGYSPSV